MSFWGMNIVTEGNFPRIYDGYVGDFIRTVSRDATMNLSEAAIAAM